jgi:hypothetical protein
MKVGVFDHLDRNDRPLHAFYEERLKIVEAYDRGGFYAYHTAEHHATPLGLAASPSVFLAAVAQRTQRLRFGPLVYTLPLHHPLRVVEEICMLDQISRDASSSVSAAASRRSRPPITGSSPTTDRRCISRRCRSCARR